MICLGQGISDEPVATADHDPASVAPAFSLSQSAVSPFAAFLDFVESLPNRPARFAVLFVRILCADILYALVFWNPHTFEQEISSLDQASVAHQEATCTAVSPVRRPVKWQHNQHLRRLC